MGTLCLKIWFEDANADQPCPALEFGVDDIDKPWKRALFRRLDRFQYHDASYRQ